MNTILRHTFGATLRSRLALLTAALGLLPAICQSQEYVVINLGTLGGTKSVAYGINDSGQVVGAANIAGDSHADPFLYSGGVMTDVAPGGTSLGATAVAINNSGHYVVNYNLNAAGDTESYLATSTGLSDLGIGGAVGMNDSDTVVGNTMFEGRPQDYWVYQNGSLNLNPGYAHSGTPDATASAVNASGVIVGMCLSGGQYSFTYGCVFGPSTTSFDLDGIWQGWPPLAIRSDNWTCGPDAEGQFDINSNNGTEVVSFPHTNGGSRCYAMNDFGLAGGVWYIPPDDQPNALLYDPINGFRNLNTLVDHSATKYSVVVQSVAAISNMGDIAANCLYGAPHRKSEAHACVLTPNYAEIIKNNVLGLASILSRCKQCSTNLREGADKLPSSFTGLSSKQKLAVGVEVQSIQVEVRNLAAEKKITTPQAILFMHQIEMALRQLGRD